MKFVDWNSNLTECTVIKGWFTKKSARVGKIGGWWYITGSDVHVSSWTDSRLDWAQRNAKFVKVQRLPEARIYEGK